MKGKLFTRWMAMLLALVLCVGLMQPLAVFAASDDEEGAGVTTYPDFLSNLKVLEVYADEYAQTSGKAAAELVINFIRTGVSRYNDGNWKTLAGEEITGFTTYVEEQDAAKGTTAMLLRNIYVNEFRLPNGNQADFGHMFGTMNIAYLGSVQTGDLGGWAGDLCDLIYYSKSIGIDSMGTIDEMADYIRVNVFGVDAEDAFGMDDFYGDLDAYYLNNMIKANAGKISALMEDYYTAELSDSDRAAYFLNNRFKGLETKEDVREAIYSAYASNVGLQVLEADRGISGETDMRTACCYAFADYLFIEAGDRLEGDTGEGEGGEGEGGEGEGGDDEVMDNEYYTVFSKTESILAPGITQSINYALTADNKQIAYYVATVDVNRDDVTLKANYRDNDPSKGWGMQRVEDQAKAMMAHYADPKSDRYVENFNVVVAINGDGYNMSTGKPGGLLVMEGVEWHPVDGDGFFAILKDGSAVIGTEADYATYKDQMQEAIGGFGAVLIRDGEVVVTKNDAYHTTRASRTAIGITADGKVVMMVLDGRQEPFSAGGSMEEIAQIMLDAGCVEAINLDGGGSTTYLSKPEGSDNLQLINRPSDGYARSVSTSWVAVSTAKSSKEFDHANITTEYDYLTIGTSLTLTAEGVSNTGNAAEVPENAQWKLSDDTIGVVVDGVFTAKANGDVTVTLTVDDKIVGSKELHVVVPDALTSEKLSMNVVYDTPTVLPLLATYNGNPVAINTGDVFVGLQFSNAGVVNGFEFTIFETCGKRTLIVGAQVLANPNAYVLVDVKLFRSDEAVFDFDDVTGGNKQLAWDRDISNTETFDNVVYHILDTDGTMDITYAFGLDMKTIDIPEQLADLIYMLPGADTGATAWEFLLQLAERVSVLTEVRVVAQFDKNLDVDISNLAVSNEYFYKKSAELDENNVLTLVCGWIDQTAAVDPATANSICILSGIKATPKEDASWNADNRLPIVNDGTVSYKIYLRASALYSFAQNPDNQEKYGLYPFDNKDVIINGSTEKGAYFGSTYATFEDTFTLDKTNRQGWYVRENHSYYYVDNTMLEAGIYYLPSFDDPSVKLFYEFGEDCACIGTVSGLMEMDGDKYYAIQGVMMTGWRAIFNAEGGSDYYYFSPADGKAVNGQQKIGGYVYTFTDYILTRGAIITDATGSRYIWAGTIEIGTWLMIDGKEYYATYPKGYFATGFIWVKDHDGLEYQRHLFDDDGLFRSDIDGLYDIGKDTYFMDHGVMVQEAGLVYVDGYYYYFASNALAVKNRDYWISKTNGLLPEGMYHFDEKGRMTNPPSTEPPTEPTEPSNPTNPTTPTQPTEPSQPTEPPVVKDGIVEEFGGLYYYKNGVKQYAAGLLKLDDGTYIYVRSNAQLAVGRYWVTNHNGLVPEGMYDFDERGRMIDPPGSEEPEEPTDPPTQPTAPPTEPTDPPTQPTQPSEPSEPSVPSEPAEPVKDGIVEENGGLFYYKNGKKQYSAGLVQLDDGSFIYVRSDASLAIGDYWVTNTNGLLPQGMYTFGEDGRMIDPPGSEEPDEPTEPPVVKDGIVEEDGGLFYYKNGKKQYAAGLIQLDDGNYIYVRSNAQLAVGRYWITNTNDLLPQGIYEFDEDGMMIDPPAAGEPGEPDDPTEPPVVKDGIVEENGGLFYYKNGQKQYAAGLIKLDDGSFIYVRSNAQLAVGNYWVTNHNGYVPEGLYTFDAQGRMVNPPV